MILVMSDEHRNHAPAENKFSRSISSGNCCPSPLLFEEKRKKQENRNKALARVNYLSNLYEISY